MFTLLSCFFTLVVIVVVFDAYKASNFGRITSRVKKDDRPPLLEAFTESSSVEANCCSSLFQNISSFCVTYFRSMIETCSAYLVIPCTFTFCAECAALVFCPSRHFRPRDDHRAAHHVAAHPSDCDPYVCSAFDIGRPDSALRQRNDQLFDCCCSQRVF